MGHNQIPNAHARAVPHNAGMHRVPRRNILASNHPWKDLSPTSFSPHSFSPLTITIALLSTFELGVLKLSITTFLSFHYPLVSASQSLTGYEPNSVASGIPDTATVVFVFDRSKIFFEEPKPFSLFLTSREALESLLNQVAIAN